MASADFDATMETLSDIFGDEWEADTMAHHMLYISHYDRQISQDLRENGYEVFVQYMQSEYGLDWENWFDWEAYREWYDSAA